MNLTRRALSALIPAIPFAGPEISKAGIEAIQKASYDKYSAGQKASCGQSLNNTEPIKKLMEEHEARRIVFNNKEVLDSARSFLYESHKRIEGVDADIMVYKSFSPMAKITFQRQRLVARDLAQFMSPPTTHWAEKLQNAISKLVWG